MWSNWSRCFIDHTSKEQIRTRRRCRVSYGWNSSRRWRYYVQEENCTITRGMNWFRQNRLRVEIRHTGSLLKMVDMPVCLQYGYDKSARNMS